MPTHLVEDLNTGAVVNETLVQLIASTIYLKDESCGINNCLDLGWKYLTLFLDNLDQV